MTATADLTDVPAAKSSKVPLILGLVLALAGGGGGFMAVQMGLIGGGAVESGSHDTSAAHDDGHGDNDTDHGSGIAFVPLDPLVISLPGRGTQRFLRFTAQIEVAEGHVDDVTTIKPRIVDVLNGYLRAVDVSELEDPTALVRLRGQMLRRIQVVAGEGQVRDLLIMEFIVN